VCCSWINGNNTGNALTVTGTANYAAGKAYIVVIIPMAPHPVIFLTCRPMPQVSFLSIATGNVTASGNISIGSGKPIPDKGVQISSTNLSNDATWLAGRYQTFTGANTLSNASTPSLVSAQG